jgi:hypothetical protein
MRGLIFSGTESSKKKKKKKKLAVATETAQPNWLRHK